jgi:glycosyltransferase involved in cell wall biosynthesis
MMVYVLVNDYSEQAGVINGGAQSARNLLFGLAQLGVPLTLVSVDSTSPGAAGPSVSASQCRFGRIHRLQGLPSARTWRDPRLRAALRSFLVTLPGGIFHLIEANATIGTWLWALEGLPFRTVVTGLDFMWMCARSHLLRSDSSICDGPRSPTDCTHCYFNHADPLRRLAQKALLASSWVPLTALSRSARRTRLQIAGRVRSFTREFGGVDALIAPSRALATAFASNGFPQTKILHVPYGTAHSHRIGFDQRPPLVEDLILGFVGRLSFDKGLDLLFDALERLRTAGLTRFRLVLYCGPHPSGFAKAVLARARAAAAWVELSSFDGRDPASIDAAHRRIHALVAPSRWYDNLPNAVLEGLERGTPVIAPDHGSMREMVVNGDNGWLYARAGGLEERLRTLLRQPQALAALPFHSTVTRAPQREANDIAALYARLATEHPALTEHSSRDKARPTARL